MFSVDINWPQVLSHLYHLAIAYILALHTNPPATFILARPAAKLDITTSAAACARAHVSASTSS